MKKTTTYIIISLLLLSCSNNRFSVIGMDFTDTCNVTFLDTLPVVLEDYGFSIYDTEMGFIAGKEENNNYIQLWNKDTGEKIFGFGSIGRGPNEFLMPFCTDVDYTKGIIYILDLVSSNMHKYKLLRDTVELIESFVVPQMTGGSLISFLDDSTFVYMALDGAMPKLVLHNRFHGKISECEDNILNEGTFNNISAIYRSSISVSKQKKKVILLCHELNTISCFSIRNNAISLEWRKFLVAPKYEISNGELLINHNQLEKGLIGDCHVTDSFIYLLVYDAKKQDLPIMDFENNLHKLEHSYIVKINLYGEVIKTYKIKCAPLYMVNSLDDESKTVLINFPNFNLLHFKL